jgi:hypothetical protein
MWQMVNDVQLGCLIKTKHPRRHVNSEIHRLLNHVDIF